MACSDFYVEKWHHTIIDAPGHRHVIEEVTTVASQAYATDVGFAAACTTKDSYTDKWHYAIIDAPGHRHAFEEVITIASLADIAVTMAQADADFTTAAGMGNHKAGELRSRAERHRHDYDGLRPVLKASLCGDHVL